MRCLFRRLAQSSPCRPASPAQVHIFPPLQYNLQVAAGRHG